MKKKHTNESALPTRLLFVEMPHAAGKDMLKIIALHLKDRTEVLHLRTTDTALLGEKCQWADMIWLESLDQLTVYVTCNLPHLFHKKVICRLHGNEVFSSLPSQVNWAAIDTLIFPSVHIQELFNQRFPDTPPKQTILQDGIDSELFTVSPSKANTKNLVLLGTFTFRKGVPLCLLFFKELLRRDNGYQLFLCGEFADRRLKLAVDTMIDELNLKAHVNHTHRVDDQNTWFADKSHILSFSLAEPFHRAIGEGMAAGLKPVIHAWRGSRNIWPDAFIFKDLASFFTIVDDDVFSPHQYRRLVIDNHLDVKHRLAAIERTIRYTNAKK